MTALTRRGIEATAEINFV